MTKFRVEVYYFDGDNYLPAGPKLEPHDNRDDAIREAQGYLNERICDRATVIEFTEVFVGDKV